MKTLITALTVVAFSLNFSFANTTNPSITLVEGKVVTIDLVDYPSGFIQIDILDNTGTRLHTEEVNTSIYTQRTYNLENLPSGSYSIKLNTSLSIVTKKIDVQKNQIELYKDTVSFKPFITSEDNIWNLNFFADKKDTQVTITDGSETLYSEIIKDEMAISKSYDLSKLVNGKYYISIRAGENFYTDSIVKS